MLDENFINFGDRRQIHKGIDAEHFLCQRIKGFGDGGLHIRLKRAFCAEGFAVDG